MSDCSFKISVISIIIHNIFCLHGDKMFIWFLTRTWSSSLLVCISCFSSSTIFSMASFSTSSRRSDICGQRQTQPCQYDSRLLVVLLVCLTLSVLHSPRLAEAPSSENRHPSAFTPIGLTVAMLSSSSSTRSRAAVLVSASSSSVPTSNTLSRYA